MKKLLTFLSVFFSVFIGFSLAANSSILNHSYLTQGDDVYIYWLDNSNGGYVDINVQDPNTQDRLHFGTVKSSDQSFVYTKQRNGEQKIWMIPSDGGDEVRFTIGGDVETSTISPTATRTVISAVPKTGPSGNLVGIILATLVIFGGYIYIRKKADI